MIKGVSKATKNEVKKQKGEFLSMLLGTLDASLLENLIAGKGVKERPGFLMSLYPLTNFEIQRYYQKEPRLNGVYSRNNIPKIKDGA